MKAMHPFIRHLLCITAAFILLNLCWQALALLLDLKALPAPPDVYGAWDKALEGGIGAHFTASMRRALLGIGISVLLGLGIGIWVGYSRKADLLFSPLLYFSYPVPKLALLPVVMLLFGVGDAAKIIIIVLIIAFQIILSVRDATRAVPEEDFALLTSLGASFAAKLRHIILPATLPALLSSVRVSIGIAFSALFFTETFGTDLGLGFYITDCQMRLDYPLMYFGILVLTLGALLLFLLADALEALACRWNTRER
ncbi:ABC transporter permease subunit [Desulfovibrio sp. OttesenSCG-928-C14]|nr:ABC transporter permease subunit [Desulfovibrio sp. OttesenSCG-928-C14]